MASTIVPAAPPPPGVTSNFESPVSRAGQLVAANVICLAIAGLFVSMRLYTRVFIVRSLGWDDCASVLAMLFSIAYSVCCFVWIQYGLGRHTWDLPYTVFFPGFLKMLLAVSLIYCSEIFFAKFSILLMYLRVFSPSKAFKYAVWAVSGFIFAWGVAGFIVIIFACRPRRRFWDPVNTPGTCVSLELLAITGGVWVILSDLFILLLPVKEVWRLNLPLRQKIALMAIFATGSAVFVVSILRMRCIVRALYNYDDSWDWVETVSWSVAEANLSIVCACMPVLKPLIRKFIPSLLANSRREVKATRDTTIELRPSLVTTEVLVTSQSRRLSMEDRLGGVGISAGYVEKA